LENKTDKLAIRFLYIIQELNSGNKLTTKELAKKFNVSERIIQKDLNDRLSQFLPITRKNGNYYLDSFLIGKLDYDDMKTFAKLSGIEKLYPSLEDTFLSDVLNTKLNRSLLVRDGSYENISDKKDEFESISLAINLKYQINFTYNDKSRTINPYKLINNDNIWYLVGSEHEQLKTYSFTKIVNLSRSEKPFEANREFLEIINKDQLKWLSTEPINIILEINNDVSEYFLRRDLLPNQTILRHTKDSLIIKTKISYEEEILKIVRYWIPHIKILEPVELQEQLLHELKRYIDT